MRLIATFWAAITRFTASLLIFAGFEYLTLKLVIVQVVIMLIMVIPSTIWFGITSTAIATAIISFLNGAFLVGIVHQRLGLRVNNCIKNLLCHLHILR